MSTKGHAQEIALLTFAGTPLLPTVLARTGPFDQGKPLLYDRFAFAADVEPGKAHNTYRQFKSDLLLGDGDLHSEKRPNWKMVDRRGLEGRIAELYRSGRPGGKQYFSPMQATEVFLYMVCSNAVRRARALFPDARSLKVHFTVPAYGGETESNADERERAEGYRARLRRAVGAFAQAPELAGVDFRIIGGGRQGKAWLYEPYGVYYYYSSFEQRIPHRDSGATYLIVDMGGSTTDVSAVQVNQTRTEFVKYPLCTSIRIGGADFDRYLVSQLAPGLSSQDRTIALQAVEAAKIQVCQTGTPAPVTVAGKVHELTPEAIEAAFRQFWTWSKDGPSLRDQVAAFIDRVKHEPEVNNLFNTFDAFSRVFLAGGSTQLPGLRALLMEVLSEAGLFNGGGHDFLLPEAGTLPSSVTALGLAAEIGRVDQLDRAGSVLAQFCDNQDRVLRFAQPGEDGAAAERGETVMYTRATAPRAAKRRKAGGGTPVLAPDHRYEQAIFQDVSLPERVTVRYRNDLQDGYPVEDHFTVEGGGKRLEGGTALLELTNEPELTRDESGVRVKPLMFWRSGAASPRRRLYREVGRRTVSLKPGPVDGDVHICIDFGMSNTSVAVFSPGVRIPRVGDVQIHTAKSPHEQRPESQGESAVQVHKVVGLPHPQSTPVPEAVAPETPATAQVAPTAPPVQQAASHDVRETAAMLEERLSARVRDVQAILDEQLSARMRDIQAMLETQLTPRLRDLHALLESQLTLQLRDEVRAALADRPDTGRPLVELAARLAAVEDGVRALSAGTGPAPLLHPADEVREEMADGSGSPLLRPLSKDEARDAGEKGREGLAERFQAFLEKHYPGLYYEPSVVHGVLAACQSPGTGLVVLAGPPGTGKSTLVRVLAHFFNRSLRDEELEWVYLLQPVSPSWFSPASLQGSYSEIEGRFQSTPFLRHLMRAELASERFGSDARRLFVCLDEFNLAQPEQYLAEILSRMEARDGAHERILTVCRRDPSRGLLEDVRVRLTANLKLYATINIDASTHLLSPKVLDRSHLVRLTPSADSLARMAARCGEGPLAWFHERFGALLPMLYDLSMHARTPLGYRAVRRAYDYAAGHPGGSELSADVVDEVLCSIVLSRLPGLFVVNTEAYEQALGGARDRFQEIGYREAAALVVRIAAGLPGQVA